MAAARDYVIGVGANLGARAVTIRAAIARLREDAATEGAVVSPVYESEALGPPGPPYLNLAVRLRSRREPDDLWTLLAGIEQALGRVRRERWASRTIDLDVLWCGDEIDTPHLRVPHPELERRWFALAPLLDVAPEAGARYRDALAALGGAPVPGRSLDAVVDERAEAAGAHAGITPR